MTYNEIGIASQYTFITPFQDLDGIYRLEKIFTFDQAIAERVDFVKDLYIPAGRKEEDFNDEFQTYQNQEILYLSSVVSDQKIPVPESILAKIPDPNIVEIDDLYIAINLGLFDDPTDLSWLVRQLEDLTTSVTGEPDTVDIYSIGKKWLTTQAFDDIKRVRQQKADQIQPFSVTVREQQEEILRLRNLVNLYETTLKAIGSTNS